MSLVREICNNALYQMTHTNRYDATRWLTQAEGAQLLEEMRGMRMDLPLPSYLGVMEPRPPFPTSVDGAVIYTPAGAVTIRVGLEEVLG